MPDAYQIRPRAEMCHTVRLTGRGAGEKEGVFTINAEWHARTRKILKDHGLREVDEDGNPILSSDPMALNQGQNPTAAHSGIQFIFPDLSEASLLAMALRSFMRRI